MSFVSFPLACDLGQYQRWLGEQRDSYPGRVCVCLTWGHKLLSLGGRGKAGGPREMGRWFLCLSGLEPKPCPQHLPWASLHLEEGLLAACCPPSIQRFL